MKKKMVKYLFLFVCAGLLMGCAEEDTGSERGRIAQQQGSEKEPESGEGGETEQEPVIEEPEREVPADEILLVNQYKNFAWGYQDSGYFIDTNGNVYGFSFSEISNSIGIGELHEHLMLIRDNVEPKANIGMNAVRKLYTLGEGIDPEAEMDRQHMAYDAGQRTLYYYDADTGEMVKCISQGDYDELPKDPKARELAAYVERNIGLSMNGIETASVYTDTDVAMKSFHCGYMDGMEGKYCFWSEELLAFAARTGLECEQILDGADEYELQNCIYLLEIRNVNSAGYDLKAGAILCQNGTAEFLLSPDSVTPQPGDMVGQMMDGFCFVAAVPNGTDIGSDWTVPDLIDWEQADALSGRFTYTNAGTVEYKDYGKTIILENVVLVDEDGNEYEPLDLVIDYDTAFAPECETENFAGYEDGIMPIEWIWKCLYDQSADSDLTMALHGVFEVEVTAGHIDSFYGSYWWD